MNARRSKRENRHMRDSNPGSFTADIKPWSSTDAIL